MGDYNTSQQLPSAPFGDEKTPLMDQKLYYQTPTSYDNQYYNPGLYPQLVSFKISPENFKKLADEYSIKQADRDKFFECCGQVFSAILCDDSPSMNNVDDSSG